MLRLPARRDQERREQRAERRSDVAADLEERLRQPVAAARRHACDPRRFGVEDRRADADETSGGDQQPKLPATDSSSSPTSVNPIPTTSE